MVLESDGATVLGATLPTLARSTVRTDVHTGPAPIGIVVPMLLVSVCRIAPFPETQSALVAPAGLQVCQLEP